MIVLYLALILIVIANGFILTNHYTGGFIFLILGILLYVGYYAKDKYTQIVNSYLKYKYKKWKI